jgi:hypothetical protein
MGWRCVIADEKMIADSKRDYACHLSLERRALVAPLRAFPLPLRPEVSLVDIEFRAAPHRYRRPRDCPALGAFILRLTSLLDDIEASNS